MYKEVQHMLRSDVEALKICIGEGRQTTIETLVEVFSSKFNNYKIQIYWKLKLGYSSPSDVDIKDEAQTALFKDPVRTAQ